ncbi:hypothetical protein AYI68_g2540 [Smittium mucronatum]|uniref:Uncharacterized protein n=1 Tax=Smittium mucronatum TaxID=133383 RepID=A0A1R0H2F0_9FUNG|nr:hypothetical protein AYI68_g2540 [Smittium mucronatum]
MFSGNKYGPEAGSELFCHTTLDRLFMGNQENCSNLYSPGYCLMKTRIGIIGVEKHFQGNEKVQRISKMAKLDDEKSGQERKDQLK